MSSRESLVRACSVLALALAPACSCEDAPINIIRIIDAAGGVIAADAIEDDDGRPVSPFHLASANGGFVASGGAVVALSLGSVGTPLGGQLPAVEATGRAILSAFDSEGHVRWTLGTLIDDGNSSAAFSLRTLTALADGTVLLAASSSGHRMMVDGTEVELAGDLLLAVDGDGVARTVTPIETEGVRDFLTPLGAGALFVHDDILVYIEGTGAAGATRNADGRVLDVAPAADGSVALLLGNNDLSTLAVERIVDASLLSAGVTVLAGATSRVIVGEPSLAVLANGDFIVSGAPQAGDSTEEPDVRIALERWGADGARQWRTVLGELEIAHVVVSDDVIFATALSEAPLDIDGETIAPPSDDSGTDDFMFALVFDAADGALRSGMASSGGGPIGRGTGSDCIAVVEGGVALFGQFEPR